MTIGQIRKVLEKSGRKQRILKHWSDKAETKPDDRVVTRCRDFFGDGQVCQNGECSYSWTGCVHIFANTAV
jgi:hypothetical protein